MSALTAAAAATRSDLVVFTCTFYKSLDDVRFLVCLEFLANAKRCGVRVVVVDASPDEAVRGAMRAAGAHAVTLQTAKGRKGAALREALAIARALAADDGRAWLCWQEPEKADMARLWARVIDGAPTLEVVVPARERLLFAATYPAEQFHSESFANAYLDLAAQKYGGTCVGFGDTLDWHFGPFALRAEHADRWLANEGELWDAQVVPIARALKDGLAVGGVEVPFVAPEAMKVEEENDFGFVEKRLMQINFLDPKVIDALKAPTGP